MTSASILLADDRRPGRELLTRALAGAGYQVLRTAEPDAAVDLVTARSVHLTIVHLPAPGDAGPQLCRRLRVQHRGLPVLALAGPARTDPPAGYLDAGADDCLPSPYALPELLARLRALLRRSGQPHRARAGRPERADPPGQRGPAAPLRCADLWLDPTGYQAGRGGRRLSLTRTEFLLLEAFLRRTHHVLTSGALLRQVWGTQHAPPTSNAVAVYVGYLRRKLDEPGAPQLIHTVRGVGYVLRED
jgi:two-component system, OmpR family, response regulator MprA